MMLTGTAVVRNRMPGGVGAWMGSTHFLTKTLDRVSTEMSLHVLAYNMKRMMNIIGTKPLIEAIGA
jgi:transposase